MDVELIDNWRLRFTKMKKEKDIYSKKYHVQSTAGKIVQGMRMEKGPNINLQGIWFLWETKLQDKKGGYVSKLKDFASLLRIVLLHLNKWDADDFESTDSMENIKAMFTSE